MKIRSFRMTRVALPWTLLFTVGCAGLGDREAGLFEQGQAAAAAQEWNTAHKHLSAVIAAAPDFTPALFLRGRSNFELGNYNDALKDYDKAQASGHLTPEEAYTATLFRGRSHLELGRLIVPDVEFRSSEGKPEARRNARDYFLKANLAFNEAAATQPGDYDVNLWKGLATLRLENYRKALDVLTLCEKASSSRWEHRFYTALAWEGLYKVNAQSLDIYFSLLESGPRRELAPLYEHLAAISGETSIDVTRKIFERIEQFATTVPDPSARLKQFLAETRAQREIDRRTARLKELADQTARLSEKGNFAEAVSAVENFVKEEGEHPQATKLLRETQESWSLLLEAKTEELAGSGDRGNLEKAAKNLDMARTLTSKVDRLVTIQQKLSVIQLALSRHETSRKIQKAYDLYKAAKHQEVLEQLSATAVDGLTERDRDLHHYLRGAASYALGQWTAAANAFSFITQRNFENLDVLHGLALIRGGRETDGLARLVNLPAEARTDEVNRVLGQRFFESRELRKAVTYLSAIKSPNPTDLESHLKARRELGMDAYRRSDFHQAVAELQAARQIIEAHLHQREIDVYLYLGNAYFRLEDYDRARKAYQDLAGTDLTAAERENCRELFLRRGQIYLREKSPDLAYSDFAEFVRLGGQIPPELTNNYGRLLATYADFLPLDRIQYWNYVSTAKDYNYTLFVKDGSGGEYRVERREAGNSSNETWTRQDILLTKKVGESLVKLPVNVKPGDETLPFVAYKSQGQDCTAEVIAIGQTVENPSGRKFTDCLKVRILRSQRTPEGGVKTSKNIHYLAPGVGEVKQEIYWDDRKVSEIVLSDFAFKAPALGN